MPGSASSVAYKLQAFTKLSAGDREALERLSKRVRVVEARRDLISEGDAPTHVHLVLQGWGARYKTLPDGKRQIVDIMIPGDFCDLNVYILKRMDHTITALTRMKVAMITPEEMDSLTSGYPRVTQALLWHELVSSATHREWVLNVGQRTAYQRLGHLFAELYIRLRTVGLTHNGGCDFPLTQNDLADATGLTPVHVNRMLQDLRRDGLIELERKHLRIPDLERLMDVSMFNANYLHLNHEGAYLDSNE
jgi:CRP-like cAMP-binding protein